MPNTTRAVATMVASANDKPRLAPAALTRLMPVENPFIPGWNPLVHAWAGASA